MAALGCEPRRAGGREACGGDIQRGLHKGKMAEELIEVAEGSGSSVPRRGRIWGLGKHMPTYDPTPMEKEF
ncbi:hypothetical protein E2562_016736 [Oryza meyeriana var. granulata]|uniref:Uncharacterized protein n=1 Tax=Oryza meyeriana var. granulata TaxID=110450 RepID=A0A6G1BWS0_9ORYZ|nr:hypothetical protein E2562_016736 [Oryza meyeriana var. granulata]